MADFCWSLPPRTLTKTLAVRRSPETSTSFTEIKPARLTGISRRIASPRARFNNSRTRSILREGMMLKHAGSKFSGDLFDRVSFDNVPRLKFIEAVDADAAFHARADFIHFVLETAQ